MHNKFKLSVNTGFALNRFTEVEELADFCGNYLKNESEKSCEVLLF